MRVCLITNLYPPYGRGGAERVVEEEARALKAHGHDVIIITGEPVRADGSIEPKMKEENGIRVYRFYPFNLFFYGEIGRHSAPVRLLWHLRDAKNGHAARTIAAILKKEKPQVVHTHNLKGLGWQVPPMLRALGQRHVHTLHDVQLVAPSGLILKGHELGFGVADPISKTFAAMARASFGSPQVVISPSKFLLRFHQHHGFFPNSAQVLLPNPAPQAPAIAHALSPDTRFLFLGQIEKHKGILLLIEAFRRLVKTHPKARLDVVGAGQALDAAIKAAGKDLRISFHGKKSPKQFAELFSSVDYAVVPSLCYENAPTVIVESFAYGVPVIAADIGGAAELIRPGKNGLAFKPGNVASLISAMKAAYDEKNAWSGRSQEALRSADAHSLDRHVGRLVALYEGRDPAAEKPELVVPIRYQPKPI